MTTRSQSLADSAPAGIAPPLPEVDAMEEMEHAGPRAVAAQQEMLSPAWRNIERWKVRRSRECFGVISTGS